jgi:predicted Fe-S protein YdhL (DUF1289 family)
LEEIKEWSIVGNDRRHAILQTAERRRQAATQIDPGRTPWPG